MAWTVPRTWVAAEVVTAALLNTHLRDNLKALGDAWASYTPAWTASTTNPTLGNGTITGVFIQPGKLVHMRVRITAGSTTTFGSGNYQVSLPANAAGSGSNMFLACEPNNAGAIYTAKGRINPAAPTIAGLYTLPTTAGNNDRAVTPTAPFTFVNGSIIELHGSYEAA